MKTYSEPFRHVPQALMVVRGLRGLTQGEAARQARLGKSQLSKYEQGKELPKLASLSRILEVLNVSPAVFFYIVFIMDELEAALSAGEREVMAKPLSPLVEIFPEETSFMAEIVKGFLSYYLENFEEKVRQMALLAQPPANRPAP